MNQEEIKTELEKLDSFRSDCEGKMITLSAALDEFITMVATLKAQLADAEKPVLQNGDYGKNCNGVNFVIHKDKLYFENNVNPYYLPNNTVESKHVFGNIVNEIELLSKPLRFFQFDVHEYKFDFKNFPDAPVCVAGNWHTLEDAKDISMKLRRLIFTAEQQGTK